MKNIIVVTAFIFTSLLCAVSTASADEFDAKKEQLVKIIDEELKEVLRLNRQTEGRDPNLRLQAAELQLEKARILKEMEMDRFLAIPAKERSRIKHSSFFKNSNAYFKEARGQCVYILKKYPRFSGKADAYYIIAYYDRDVVQKRQRAIKNFELARKYSRPGSAIHNKSTMALAELYYNNKNYRKAIPLYEQGLRGQKTKWWTKDSHSLAWCYFRVGRHDDAIALMERVNRVSGDDKYIDVSKAARRDLAYFYTASGKTKQAVAMAERIGGNTVDNLYNVGKHARNQGLLKKSYAIFATALKQQPSEEQFVKLHLAMIEVADRMGDFDKIYTSANALVPMSEAGKLDSADKELLEFFIQKSAASLQQAVAGKAYRHTPKVRTAKMHQAVRFFELFKRVKPENDYKIELLIAETYFNNSHFNEAIPHYDAALKGATRAGNKKFQNDALNGLSASLDKPQVSKGMKDKYMVATYMAFLKKNPKSKEADKVWQRLFKLYQDDKDYENCERVLIQYKKNFPHKRGQQEAMLGVIVDHAKSQRDINAMKNWDKRIKSGEFKVNPKFRKSLSQAILQLQFENIEASSARGDKVAALKGYINSYADPTGSQEQKINAAFNSAVLFQKLGNAEMTYRWTMRSIEITTPAQMRKYEEVYNQIALFLFEKRRIDWAVDVYQALYDRLCHVKSKNKVDAFRNIYVLKLADSRMDELPALFANAPKCKVPTKEINNGRLEFINELAKIEAWHNLENQIKIAERDPNNLPSLIVPANKLYEAYLANGRRDLAQSYKNKINGYFNKSVARRKFIDRDARDVIADYKLKNFVYEYQKLVDIKLEYPEKVFNDRLGRKLKQLDRLRNLTEGIKKVGSGRGGIRAYKYLRLAYSNVANEIDNFTPQGKDPNYVKQFKAAMKNISVNLHGQANYFKDMAVKEMHRSTILSPDNTYFITDPRYPIDVEYKYHRRGVIQDRGGNR